MIKQYPQAPRIGKANLCHSDSPKSRYMTQANQNSLTCYRILAKKASFPWCCSCGAMWGHGPLCGAWTICGHASLSATTFASHTTGEKERVHFQWERMRPTRRKKEKEWESEIERGCANWQDGIPSPRGDWWFMAVLFPLTSDWSGDRLLTNSD